MLHFAYGSNLDSRLMRRRCPGAQAVGVARLDGWRFIITHDGYASVVPGRGSVFGALWRVTPRDLSALNAYENLDGGLYHRRTLSIRHGAGRVPALVYVARDLSAGRPRPGYLELVISAAREWQLPTPYLELLAQWSRSGLRAARQVEVGEMR
jgi:gamma-glutamylcyclotransferase (GGCT)/AIG2-like uncharacterized protein YtfP